MNKIWVVIKDGVPISAFVYSPLISFDYALTPKISFTIQGIYLVAKYEKNSLYNPTLQFGILFNR